MNDPQSHPSQERGDLFATLEPLFLPSPRGFQAILRLRSRPLRPRGARPARPRASRRPGGDVGVCVRHRAFAGARTRYGFHRVDFACGSHAVAALPRIASQFVIAIATADAESPA